MAETVNDILGKGFEFEQRIEVEQVTEILTGTIAALIGGAHWGPVGVPTFISKFVNTFGNPLDRADGADFSGMAADYFLDFSPYVWFTRVADGSQMKAKYQYSKAAQVGKITGSAIVANKSFVIQSSGDEQNDKLKISFDTGTGFTPITITLDPTPACDAVESATMTPDPSSVLTADKAFNFTAGSDYLEFVVDDVTYKYVIKDEEITNLDEPDFLRLVVSDQHDAAADALGNTPTDYPDTPNTEGGTGLTYWDDYKTLVYGGTQGYQEFGLSKDLDVDDAGLLTADTPFYFKVNGTEYSIAGATSDTYETIRGRIATALAATDFTCTTVGSGAAQDIRITNKDVGNQSTVAITAGTTGSNLLAKMTGVAVETAVAGVESSYVARLAYALKTFVVQPTLDDLGITDYDAADVVTVDGNKIVLNSQAQGAASRIIIYKFPKAFVAAAPETPIVSTSTDTSIDTIVDKINDEIDGSGTAWIEAISGYITIATEEAGLDQGVKIEDIDDNFYVELGIEADMEDYGEDLIDDGGTFEAAYPGEDGNTIVINKTINPDGKTLKIYIRDQVVGSFFNYSYVVADANYIGTLINQDAEVAKVVTFLTPEGLTEIPEFPAGDTTLYGGTSGLSGLANLHYNEGLEEYKNLDLYQLDLIGVPGSVSESVVDKIQEVCEYRKDCFGIVDLPENKAGLPALGGSIYNAINWHNGVVGSGRSKKIESMYLSLYFPWMQVGADWYPPSIRTFGAIANSDKVAGHKFAAPAGPRRTTISSIDSLAIYLREDERKKLYADELGNSINPIVFDKNRGFFIDGQKNTDRTYGAISRHNVLRTALHIKKYMYSIAPDFFWEPLTKTTMDELYAVLEKLAEDLVAKKAIKPKEDPNYGYIITTGTSINTPIIEAKRGLIGILEWTPVRSIEKIKIISVIKDMKVTTVIGL